MKKRFLVLLFLLCCLPKIAAEPKVELGVGGGIFAPQDAKVQETFGNNFYFHGQLGILDENAVWEARAEIGHYSDLSHFPGDQNFRADVTPLTASVIFHVMPTGSAVQPYIGGGLGAYMYHFGDATDANLESGTKFGAHVLTGLKLNISPEYFVNAEFRQQFVPQIFFSKSNSFDSAILTVSLGAYLSPAMWQSHYSDGEKQLLSQIQQVSDEIKKLQQKRDKINLKIQTFYVSTNEDAAIENSPEFADQFRKIKYLEGKVAEIEKKLDEDEKQLDFLNRQWQAGHSTQPPVEQHVMFMEDNLRSTDFRPVGGHTTPFYNDADYVPPSAVPTKAPATPQEKKDFAAERKKHLEELKNR
jgi:opacity protein-like surface antigen